MENNKAVGAWNNILGIALKIPGAKVSRSDFLRNQFSKYCNEDVLKMVLETGPIKAGIDLELLDNIADDVINYHTGIATTSSAAAGMPGGVAMAATIPLDLGQFYWHVIVLCQKLAYIYGWPEIDDGLNDDFKSIITLFIGVMSGVNVATQGVKKISQIYLAKGVVKLAAMKGLGNTVIYKIAAQVAKRLGIQMSKKIFAQGVAKVIPLVSGGISGILTFATFLPMAKKLKNKLKTDSEFMKLYS